MTEKELELSKRGRYNVVGAALTRIVQMSNRISELRPVALWCEETVNHLFPEDVRIGTQICPGFLEWNAVVVCAWSDGYAAWETAVGATPEHVSSFLKAVAHSGKFHLLSRNTEKDMGRVVWSYCLRDDAKKSRVLVVQYHPAACKFVQTGTVEVPVWDIQCEKGVSLEAATEGVPA